MEITTSSTQLQALTDAFLYLVAYPFECAEQLSSRVLAVAALRDVLVRHLFTLPDGPETPPFTIEDFDELAREGKSAESLMMYEQTVGRRVRMEDGKEIVVKQLDPDDDFYFEE